MANALPKEKQVAVINAVIEGCSIRSTERTTGVNRETAGTLLTCADLRHTRMQNLARKSLEIDELWAFVGKKQRHVRRAADASRVGDTWTFVVSDAETKLIPSFVVGKPDAASTHPIISEVAARTQNRVQLSTDGLCAYIDAIGTAFAETGGDYAQLHKTYQAEPTGPGRYSPPKVVSTEKTPVIGEPIAELVSALYVERQNLTVRMGVRRYTPLTNAFSKKIENHIAATALHFAHYNFVRQHKALRTPAMAAGIEATLWSTTDLLDAKVGERP